LTEFVKFSVALVLLPPYLKDEMKKLFIFLALLSVFLFFFGSQKQDEPKIFVTDFISCLEAGNPIMESYPRQCRADGETFIENIGNELEKINLVRLSNPRPNQKVSSPLFIKGEARGRWYFEATFPVVLTNWDGLIIAKGFATAEDEWMTENFVPFIATLEFKKPDYKENGYLILQKNNPSGLPEFDEALEIPLLFE